MRNRDRGRLAAAAAMLLVVLTMPSHAQEESVEPESCASASDYPLPASSASIDIPAETGAAAPCPPPEPQRVRPPAPDIFGSVALPVGATPFDERWQAVRAEMAGDTVRAWSAIALQVEGLERERRLQAINNWVNSHIAFAEDESADIWESLPQSFASRRGDCEDYAIAKMQLLEEAGFPADDLYLVIVADTGLKKDHAILAVRDGGELLVLDNKTDRILQASQIADYRPVVSFSSDFAWTHGYRSAAALRAMAEVQPGAKEE